MDNPIGGIRRGWPEIRDGHVKLFAGNANVYVEFYDYTIQRGEEWALAVGGERGRCVTLAGKEIALFIRTSRLFVFREGRWRQFHHHGSIEVGQLLMEYQEMILGAPLGRE